MKYMDWYRGNWEGNLRGRYITLKDITPLLENYTNDFSISLVGFSELGKEIPMIRIGNGSKVVLAWSQMHGNESTTTKAIFDLLKFLNQKNFFQSEITKFLEVHSLYILPILNPDGAKSYTRENANGKDLNRDAEELSQKESRVLRDVFTTLKPNLCLNLHDQRSIYGFKESKPATISFLSPAADANRELTEARKIAMRYIVKMNSHLQTKIPGEVGRYDDSFNSACVGDYFQKEGVPTILFEAGHYRQDYLREKTREFIFYAFLSLFDLMNESKKEFHYEEYFGIPENLKNYRDVILRNVKSPNNHEDISIAVQYKEVLKDDKLGFIPVIDKIGNLENIFGHREIDIKRQSILINSSKLLEIGTHISQITDKNGENIGLFY